MPETKFIFPRNKRYVEGKTWLLDQQLSLLTNLLPASFFLMIAVFASICSPDQRSEGVIASLFIALIMTIYSVKFIKMFLVANQGTLNEGVVTKVEFKSRGDTDGCEITFRVDDGAVFIEGVADSPHNFVVGDKVAVVVFESDYVVL